MGTRFKKARFHFETGPKSLFDRVLLKMNGTRRLKYTNHFRNRMKERSIPINLIELFDSSLWDLVTAEVRTDTCKFVNSCWRRKFEEGQIWIVIGFGDAIETAFFSNKTGLGPSIVRDGRLYEDVDLVNSNL